MLYNRRQFLGAVGKTTGSLAFAGAVLNPNAPKRLERIFEAARGRTPQEIAQDESYWFDVQKAFTVDRSLINFNNGGVSPSPAYVQEAMKRYLDYSNTAPTHAMWAVIEPQIEGVRKRLARSYGCSPEEIAITRNASEGLQICQLGFDLLPGDEVLTTTQDYGRMVTTFKQRERREKIVLKQFQIPVPAENDDEIAHLFEQNITSKTKLILMCHMINLTGQILPVKKVVNMARKKDIPVIVDGAHAFAHFDFMQKDLDCDYYATSLHKWLFAPHGTGMLYVKKDKIPGLWPLMAAPDKMDDNIRKFEEIGTHPAANHNAIAEALTFHEGIGPKNKEARLIYLRDRWANRLLEHDRLILHTSQKPGFACGIGNVQVEGIDSAALRDWLWEKYRIIVVAIKHKEFEGLRVSPSVYTTLEEIDRFCEAMEVAIEKGIETV
jgi:selenocysteine lyase/cysteine desulfurase